MGEENITFNSAEENQTDDFLHVASVKEDWGGDGRERMNLSAYNEEGYVSTLILPLASFARVEILTVSAQPMPNNLATTQSKKVIARIWHGTTLTSKADKYYAYLVEAGMKKIESIPGNLGVQVLCHTDGNNTEFTVISYWESRDAIRKFAGNDIEKVRFLPRDKEYLIKPETTVKHFDVMLDNRK